MPNPLTEVPISDWDREAYIIGREAVSFDQVLTSIERYSTELCVETQPVARGSIDAYNLMEVLRDALVRRADATGDTVVSDLSPQLIGLEGHRVAVENGHGERYTFTVARSKSNPPYHIELHADGAKIPAWSDYTAVEVVA